MNLYELTVHELKEKLEKKEITAEEITQSYVDRMAEKEKDVKAFVTTTEEQALQNAKEMDEKRAKGEKVSPLAGIPIGIKDNICTKGVRTTCSSKMLLWKN